ncbi:hypothetical protein J6S88_08165 [bacterium]|nr:hypothetical protein [bacterium]
MKKNFDVNKSFEIFWREPLSILTEGLFRLVNIQSNIFGGKPSVNIDIVDKKTQITVVDSDKVYNLFQTVLYKKRLKEQREKVLNSK